jgi:DNA-binding IclR family transcriptional regulator
VVSRGVALLRALDAQANRLTLTELARRAALPLATAHGLVGELTTGGLLSRGPNGK